MRIVLNFSKLFFDLNVQPEFQIFKVIYILWFFGHFRSLLCYFFFQVCMGIVCFLFLPRESVSSETSQSCKKLSILKVLRIPTIWFSFMGFIVATVCNGFLSINLEPQVRFRFIVSENIPIGTGRLLWDCRTNFPYQP